MYDHLLLDADGTLFDFLAAERWAIGRLLELLGKEPLAETMALYSHLNHQTWLAFEKGELSMEQLKTERFRRFFDHINMNVDPSKASNLYSQFLGQTHHLYPDALDALKQIQSMGIPMSMITNGITVVQKGRIEASKIGPFFTHIIISEEIGAQKPDPRYFEKTLSIIKEANDPCSACLVIGDSLSSDIKGGIDSNLDTCWVNRNQETLPADLRPTYEISDLSQLPPLIAQLCLQAPHQK